MSDGNTLPKVSPGPMRYALEVQEQLGRIEAKPQNHQAIVNEGNSLHSFAVQCTSMDHDQNVAMGDSMTLHTACLNGLTRVAAYLLENGTDVQAQNSDGDTPFHLAARKCSTSESLDLLKLLHSHGADPNTTNYCQWTPLDSFLDGIEESCLSTTYKWNVIKWFVEETRPLTPRQDGFLLDWCVKRNNNWVNWLLSRGVKEDDALYETKVMLWSSPSPVSYGMGADYYRRCLSQPNLQDSHGNTLLHRAAAHCKDRVKWLVLKKQADPNMVNSHRFTPLHIAVHEGKLETAKWLCEYGVNLSARNNDRRTPAEVESKSLNPNEQVHLVCFFKNVRKAFSAINKDRIDLLQEALDSPPFRNFCAARIRDKHGNTMLLSACAKRRSLSMIELLCRAPCVDLLATNHARIDAAHIAANDGRLDLLKYLDELGGVNYSSWDKNPRTLMHVAVERGDIFMLDWLISKKGLASMYESSHRRQRSPIQCASLETIAHFLVQHIVKN